MLILLFFMILFFSPLLYLFVIYGNSDVQFFTKFINPYIRNPIAFVTSFDTSTEFSQSDYALQQTPFSELEEIDVANELPEDVPFTFNEIKPMQEAEFVEIRDRNLFGDGSNKDEDFVVIDVYNAQIGNDLIGGMISYSGNPALTETLITAQAYCQSDNSFVYDSDWQPIQVENVDFWGTIEKGNQLVTSCLTKDCQYVGSYCAIIKW